LANLNADEAVTFLSSSSSDVSKAGFRKVRGFVPLNWVPIEHFHQSCSDELNPSDSGLFGFLASFRLSHRVFQTCSFTEASPKTKNPRCSSLYLFCQCSSKRAPWFKDMGCGWQSLMEEESLELENIERRTPNFEVIPLNPGTTITSRRRRRAPPERYGKEFSNRARATSCRCIPGPAAPSP
jgi:hypothetical protein